MNCKYCRGTKIWTSPIMGGEYPCEECATETKSDVKYDEGSGILGHYRAGATFWKVDGSFHREGGPAMEFSNGTKKWWLNGHLHRTDGPAIMWGGFNDGHTEYYLYGYKYSKETWEEKLNELGLAS